MKRIVHIMYLPGLQLSCFWGCSTTIIQLTSALFETIFLSSHMYTGQYPMSREILNFETNWSAPRSWSLQNLFTRKNIENSSWFHLTEVDACRVIQGSVQELFENIVVTMNKRADSVGWMLSNFENPLSSSYPFETISFSYCSRGTKNLIGS